MSLDYHLILASKSPRRQALLQSLGLEFEVRTQDVEETYPAGTRPEKVAEYLAIKKSEAFSLSDRQLLITADTVVLSNHRILGKPRNAAEATSMLRDLSGSMHQVISGVCLKTIAQTVSFDVTTKVWFRNLEDEAIAHYIKCYRPFDKAGAYGIQEWIGMIGVEGIEGDYYNVMGLPVGELYARLKKHFT